jgi:hypothetical protein
MTKLRHTELPVVFKRMSYPGQDVLKVDFGVSVQNEWCLDLVLLREGLVDQLELSDLKRTYSLSIAQSKSEHSAITWKKKSASLALDVNRLDYLISYFLKFFRDGVAEVDHIDLETRSVSGENKEAYVTFAVSKATPSITGNELRKLLGDKE